jgi:hypothetical protein
MTPVHFLAGGLLFGYLVGQSAFMKYYFYKEGQKSKTRKQLENMSEEELNELIKQGKVVELTKDEVKQLKSRKKTWID